MSKVLNCADCGTDKSKKGIYCKSCSYKHRKRPSGLKYNLKVENQGWFKKGELPVSYQALRDWWAIEANREFISEKKKGVRVSPQTEFKREQVLGEKNTNWKGDSVGYGALHTWVRRNKTLQNKCEWCQSKQNINLANLDFQYSRNLDTWAELCVKCHKKYDAENGWGLATLRFNLGKSQ